MTQFVVVVIAVVGIVWAFRYDARLSRERADRDFARRQRVDLAPRRPHVTTDDRLVRRDPSPRRPYTPRQARDIADWESTR